MTASCGPPYLLAYACIVRVNQLLLSLVLYFGGSGFWYNSSFQFLAFRHSSFLTFRLLVTPVEHPKLLPPTSQTLDPPQEDYNYI